MSGPSDRVTWARNMRGRNVPKGKVYQVNVLWRVVFHEAPVSHLGKAVSIGLDALLNREVLHS